MSVVEPAEAYLYRRLGRSGSCSLATPNAYSPAPRRLYRYMLVALLAVLAAVAAWH